MTQRTSAAIAMQQTTTKNSQMGPVDSAQLTTVLNVKITRLVQNATQDMNWMELTAWKSQKSQIQGQIRVQEIAQ